MIRAITARGGGVLGFSMDFGFVGGFAFVAQIYYDDPIIRTEELPIIILQCK